MEIRGEREDRDKEEMRERKKERERKKKREIDREIERERECKTYIEKRKSCKGRTSCTVLDFTDWRFSKFVGFTCLELFFSYASIFRSVLSKKLGAIHFTRKIILWPYTYIRKTSFH